MQLKHTLIKIREFVRNAWLFFMSPSVTMSNSRLNSYQTCPLKYKYRYEDGIKGFPSCYLHFGSVVHTALEKYHSKFDLHGEEGNLDDLIKEYEKAWPIIKQDMQVQARGPAYHRWKVALADNNAGEEDIVRTLENCTSIYSSKQEEEEFYERGIQMLEEYLQDNQANPNKIVEIEKALIMTLRGVDILAYIDRIEKTPAGKLVIVDYKTGERTMEEVGVSENQQAIIYSMLADKKWKGKLDNFYFYYLSNRTGVPCTPKPEMVEKTSEDIIQTEKNIRYKKFDPAPGPLCGWCDYEIICPQWKGPMARYRGIFRQAKKEDRMAFSYSKMSTYKNCPYNYKKLYIDKETPRAQRFFSIGHSCHETMEVFFTYPYQPSIKQMRRMFEDNWHREGYESLEEEMEYRKKGWQWLVDYYKKYIDGQYIQAYEVEKYFQLPIGKEYVIIGYIDRLQKNPDGTFEILDYKTDPKLRTPGELDRDLQLTSYYWAMKEMGIEVNKLSLEFLQFTQRVSTTRTDEDVPVFIDTINEVVGEMDRHTKELKKHPEKSDKLFKPKINKYCGGCDYFQACPKKEEIKRRADEIGIMNMPPEPMPEPEQPVDEASEEEKYHQ